MVEHASGLSPRSAGSKPVAVAPATARTRAATVVRSHQQEQTSAASLDRRALLAGLAVSLVAAQQQGQPAAAAEECAFQTAPNGLQWCDVVEGSGDAPVQGESPASQRAACFNLHVAWEGTFKVWGRRRGSGSVHGEKSAGACCRLPISGGLCHASPLGCQLSCPTPPWCLGAMIRAHYTGRLASNGAVFDSSYPRGKPLQFKIGVGQVIKASRAWAGRGRPGTGGERWSCYTLLRRARAGWLCPQRRAVRASRHGGTPALEGGLPKFPMCRAGSRAPTAAKCPPSLSSLKCIVLWHASLLAHAGLGPGHPGRRRRARHEGGRQAQAHHPR